MGQNGSVAQPVEKETEMHRNPFFSTNVKKFQNYNYNSNNSSIKSPHNFKQNFNSNVFSTNPFSPTNQNSQANMVKEKDNTHTHNQSSSNSKYNNYLR